MNTEQLSIKIEEYVLGEIAVKLEANPDNLDKDENLLELGLDSATLVEFAEDFEKNVGIKLYPTIFFEHQTLNQVNQYFSEKFADEFMSYFKKNNSVPIQSENQVQEKPIEDSKVKEERMVHELLWVDLGPINLIKQYELNNSFSAIVTELNTEDTFLINSDSKVVFYLNESPNYNVFDILRFLSQNVKGRKPKEVILIIENDFEGRDAIIKDFVELPYDSLSLQPFRTAYLSRFSTDEIQNALKKSIKSKDLQSTKDDDIAIIGMDGRFPQSPNLEAYWDNLLNEKDLIGPPDEARLNMWKTICEPLGEGFLNQAEINGGFIDNVDKFDNEFFNISAREAQSIDPQQRLFLTSSWKCIQNAGYSPESLSDSKTGVFGAVGTRDYHELSLLYRTPIEPQLSTGLAHSILSNRVSYVYNFNGPSESIDTACSSSLVALNRAISAIKGNECDQAIVGGVNLNISPMVFLAFHKTGILSEEGRCRPFDERANGYARGEGVGTILIKPLQKAITDGDYIHGVIKGTAVNHGGKGQSMTAPNPSKQSEVVANAIEKSGCDIDTISYIEAHGTGTALGDPIEIDGLKRTFKSAASKKNMEISKPWCKIGSVKSNIGHLETAAGMAGILKVLLAFDKKAIPASIHIQNVNPLISLKNSPFEIAKESSSWLNPHPSTPLRAGVSSFGFGGTNAHAVLEEYLNTSSENRESIFSIPFSAPSEVQLVDYIKKFINLSDKYQLTDIAFTLQNGRELLEKRVVFECSNITELKQKIKEYIISENQPNVNLSPSLSFLEGVNPNWRLKGKRVPLPTFDLNETRHWFDEPNWGEFNFKKSTSSVQQEKATMYPSIEGKELSFKEFLKKEISEILKKDLASIDEHKPFLDYGLDSILGMSLVKKIEAHLGIPIYINELLQYDTIAKLSDHFSGEIKAKKITSENQFNLDEVEYDERERGDTPICFLLSTPRAGSTLLRSMLMGNEKLFSPPELHLLNFSNVEERKKWLKNTPLYEGIIESIKELFELSVEESKALLSKWENERLSTPQVYQKLQSKLADKVLIDKSPSYAQSIETLKRAEKYFSNTRYIILQRHPFSVMESIVRNRFHHMIPIDHNDHATAEEISEKVWYDFNQNLEQFKEVLSPDNFIVVQYENLVQFPENELQKICSFLEVDYDPKMLSVYNTGRMINGLTKDSISIGDPNFLKRGSIDNSLAFSWKNYSSKSIGIETLKYATSLGYDLKQDYSLTPIQKAYFQIEGAESWMLAHKFEFSVNSDVTNSKINSALLKLLNDYPSFHRKLKGDTWEWEADLNSLIGFEFSKENDLNLDDVIQIKGSKINVKLGLNLYLIIHQKSKSKYEAVLMYSHLLGDGVSSTRLIDSLVSFFNGKSPEINRQIELLNDLSISQKQIHFNSFNPLKGGNSQLEFKKEIQELNKSNNLFSEFGSALADSIYYFFDEDQIDLSVRYHNRNQLSEYTDAPFDFVGLLAVDIPLCLNKEDSQKTDAYFINQMQKSISSEPKNCSIKGKYRFNFQPINKSQFTSPIKITQSKEYIMAKPVSFYEIDVIVRSNYNSTEVIARFDSEKYSESFISNFISDIEARITKDKEYAMNH